MKGILKCSDRNTKLQIEAAQRRELLYRAKVDTLLTLVDKQAADTICAEIDNMIKVEDEKKTKLIEKSRCRDAYFVSIKIPKVTETGKEVIIHGEVPVDETLDDSGFQIDEPADKSSEGFGKICGDLLRSVEIS